jgi:hypothetical protein
MSIVEYNRNDVPSCRMDEAWDNWLSRRRKCALQARHRILGHGANIKSHGACLPNDEETEIWDQMPRRCTRIPGNAQDERGCDVRDDECECTVAGVLLINVPLTFGGKTRPQRRQVHGHSKTSCASMRHGSDSDTAMIAHVLWMLRHS